MWLCIFSYLFLYMVMENYIIVIFFNHVPALFRKCNWVVKHQSNLGISGCINWLWPLNKTIVLRCFRSRCRLIWAENDSLKSHKSLSNICHPSPKAHNMADKNDWPHTKTKINSKIHLSLPQWFLVSYAYGIAVVRAFLYNARWKPLTQRLITLFIYYYLCPGAKNTINLAKPELKDSTLTCFQFKLNHGCIK